MINTTEDIKNFINDNSFKKIYVLCGKKSFTTSGAQIFFNRLLDKKDIKLFYKNSDLPILEELVEIIRDIKNFKPDLIIAVGGGAVIDYAKIANVVDIRNDLRKLIVSYSYPFRSKYTKLAVIPTTAGSGAEVTSNAVIYVDGIKHSFESELLIPDNFFLIPEFLISAPNYTHQYLYFSKKRLLENFHESCWLSAAMALVMSLLCLSPLPFFSLVGSLYTGALILGILLAYLSHMLTSPAYTSSNFAIPA